MASHYFILVFLLALFLPVMINGRECEDENPRCREIGITVCRDLLPYAAVYCREFCEECNNNITDIAGNYTYNVTDSEYSCYNVDESCHEMGLEICNTTYGQANCRMFCEECSRVTNVTEVPTTTTGTVTTTAAVKTPAPTTAPHLAECNTTAEVIFILDASSSVGEQNFEKMRVFTQNVTGRLKTEYSGLNVTVITFSDTATLAFHLEGSDNMSDIQAAIANVSYTHGGTNTHLALNLMAQSFHDDNYGPKIAIVITDGASFEPDRTKDEATQAKDQGAIIFVVGVGDDVNEHEAMMISSEPHARYYYRISNFGALDSIVGAFHSQNCLLPRPSPTTTTTTPAATTTTSTTVTTTTTAPKTTTAEILTTTVPETTTTAAPATTTTEILTTALPTQTTTTAPTTTTTETPTTTAPETTTRAATTTTTTEILTTALPTQTTTAAPTTTTTEIPTTTGPETTTAAATTTTTPEIRTTAAPTPTKTAAQTTTTTESPTTAVPVTTTKAVPTTTTTTENLTTPAPTPAKTTLKTTTTTEILTTAPPATTTTSEAATTTTTEAVTTTLEILVSTTPALTTAAPTTTTLPPSTTTLATTTTNEITQSPATTPAFSTTPVVSTASPTTHLISTPSSVTEGTPFTITTREPFTITGTGSTFTPGTVTTPGPAPSNLTTLSPSPSTSTPSSTTVTVSPPTLSPSTENPTTVTVSPPTLPPSTENKTTVTVGPPTLYTEKPVTVTETSTEAPTTTTAKITPIVSSSTTTTVITTPTTPGSTTTASCVAKVADIVFVVDSSGSIGLQKFEDIKNFITEVIKTFDANDTRYTRVGLIEFSTTASIHFKLGEKGNMTELINGVMSLPYSGGGTATSDALQLMRQEGFDMERADAPNIAIVITDGLSKYPALTRIQAAMAKSEGITIFTIGIGNETEYSELLAMASDKSFVVQVGDVDKLKPLDSVIAHMACGVNLPDSHYTRPTTTLSPSLQGCNDLSDDCDKYPTDFCTDFEPYARHNCPVTCKFCPENATSVEPPCKDDPAENCGDMGFSGCNDDTLYEWNAAHCPKFCGFCTSKTDPLPTNRPVTEPPPAPTCFNHQGNCHEFGGLKMCATESYNIWAHENCAKYCGFCYVYQNYTSEVVGGTQCPSWTLPIECTLEYVPGQCCPFPVCPEHYRFTVKRRL